jgi:hypothetical protein
MPEYGAIQEMVDPETGGLAFGQLNSSGAMELLRDAAGEKFRSADKLDPARAAALLKYHGIESQLSSMKGQISDYEMEKMKDLQSRILERRKPTGPMSKSELSSRAQRGQSQEQIEAEAIERSYDTVGTGGYIIEHANGALEWVPNGPGDQPQPPTGDVFYDPIKEEQRKVSDSNERRDTLQRHSPEERQWLEQQLGRPIKFARGGVVKNFKNGGLAAVTDVEEEMETPEGAIEVDQLVERTTNPAAGQSLTSMILQNKQDALDRLKHGRTQIAERRDAQRKRDESQKWLSFAQGMLAPTRTGSFGESLGTTAGLLAQQTELRSGHEAQFDEQLDENMYKEIAMESEAIDKMLELAGHGAAGKSVHGSIQTMVHPDDMGNEVEDQRIVFGAMQVDPEHPELGLKLTPLEGPGGTMFEAASKLDPARAAALIRAAELAQASTGRSQDFITEAYGRKAPLQNIREVNRILENADVEIKTSGVQALKNRLANWIGVDFGDTTELSVIQMKIAEDYLSKLSALKGPASDKDLAEMKGVSVGMGMNTTANYRVLKDLEKIYATAMSTGVREAWYSANKATSPIERRQFMSNVSDLWEGIGGFPFAPDAVFISTKKNVTI